MKKTILAAILTMFAFTSAYAGPGIKIGISAQIGSMETSAQEKNSDGVTPVEKSGTEEFLFGTGGYFIEKDLAFLPSRLGDIGSRIHIGYDNIVHDLDIGTQSNVRNDSLGAAGATVRATVNSVKANVTGFETVYATFNITDWLYVKAGDVTVDVDTTFKGTTTSSYAKNHSLDGSMIGFGISKQSENGLFFRLEYNDYDIDGKSVTNAGTDSKFTATLNDVSGTTGRISIGKAF